MRSLYLLAVILICGGSVAQTLLKISPDQCDPQAGCLDLINGALTQCQSAASSCEILFLPGTYDVYFPSYYQNAIMMSNIKAPLTLSGYNATILIHGRHGAFYGSSLTSVEVEGFTFDYYRVPFTLAQLASVNGNEAVFKVNTSEYPFPLENPDYAWLTQVEAILEYNLTSNRIAEHSIDWYLTLTGAWDNSSDTFSISGISTSSLTIGSYYIIRHQVYSFNVFTFINTPDINIHDVNLWAAPGMGFYAAWAGAVTIDNYRVEKVFNRPMSLCADAFHIDFGNGPVSITNSFFEGQGDDGLNIHADYMQIGQINSPTEVVLVAKGTHPLQGDIINIRSQSTFQIINTNQIVSMNGSAPESIDLFSSYCPSSLGENIQWCKERKEKVGTMTGTSYVVTLKDPLPSSVQVDDIIGAPTWLPTSVILKNNIYKDNRARGQLLTINNVLAQNNTYDHQTGAAILIEADCNYWFQSDTTTNMTLTGNTFINPNYAMATEKGDIVIAELMAGAVYLTQGQVNANITIEGNTFIQTQGENAIVAYATDGLTIANNKIQYSPQPSSTFFLSNNADVNVINNECYLDGSPQTCAQTGN